MFLSSLPNSTLNLFLVAIDVAEFLETKSQISSHFKPEKGHGSK